MNYDFISALTAVASNYKLCLILHHLILSFIPVFMLHIAVETKPAQLTLEFLAFQCCSLSSAWTARILSALLTQFFPSSPCFALARLYMSSGEKEGSWA